MKIRKNILHNVIRYLITAAALLSVLAVFVSAEGIWYYGYEQLTDVQQKAYDAIHTAMSADTPQTVSLDAADNVAPEDIKPALLMYKADHPEVFWNMPAWSCFTNGNYKVTSITFSYEMGGAAADVQAIKAAKTALNAKIAEIDSALKAANLTTDAQKALWLHDKVAEVVEYQFTANDQTAYGALVEGQAVCSGYARLYQLLLQRNGISAYTVTGDSYNPANGKTVAHAWTLMWLGEKCLYTDVTWDDQGEELFHLYYCRTLAEFAGSHIPDTAAKLPECSCTAELVYDEGSIFTESTTAADVAGMLTGNDDHEVVLYFATQELYDNLTDEFLTEIIYEVLSSIHETGGTLEWDIIDRCGIEIHLRFLRPVTIQGNISSWGDPAEPITVELFRDGSEEIIPAHVEDDGDYSVTVFTGDYTLRVSKKNHVPREYKIRVQ